MRKIDLTPYPIEVLNPETGDIRTVPYDVRKSIEVILLNGEKMPMSELLKNARLADIVLHEPETFILLEDEDYRKIKSAFDDWRGFKRNEVELCRRIEEAEKVTVEEKKK